MFLFLLLTPTGAPYTMTPRQHNIAKVLVFTPPKYQSITTVDGSKSLQHHRCNSGQITQRMQRANNAEEVARKHFNLTQQYECSMLLVLCQTLMLSGVLPSHCRVDNPGIR